jgi:hypothetical protein
MLSNFYSMIYKVARQTALKTVKVGNLPQNRCGSTTQPRLATGTNSRYDCIDVEPPGRVCCEWSHLTAGHQQHQRTLNDNMPFCSIRGFQEHAADDDWKKARHRAIPSCWSRPSSLNKPEHPRNTELNHGMMLMPTGLPAAAGSAAPVTLATYVYLDDHQRLLLLLLLLPDSCRCRCCCCCWCGQDRCGCSCLDPKAHPLVQLPVLMLACS